MATKEHFYGVGEPLIFRQMENGIDAVKCLDLVVGMGCKAFRSWMHLTDLLEDPTYPRKDMVEAHRKLLSRAKELGLEVMGMSHEWFLPKGCIQSMGHAMPVRDLSEGSLYREALDMLEQSWYTQASLFPEVDIWEIGNEWNLNAFLHPDGFLERKGLGPFTADEKADIAMDLMYFSARGVRRANPAAKVTSYAFALSTPGLGGDMPEFLSPMYGIAWFMDKMYARIFSGKFWSSDPDDYFDMLAWHPYVVSTQFGIADKELFRHLTAPDNLWKDYNDAAYRVMQKYGQGDKEVILSETGFTDFGDPALENLYADYNKKIMEIAAELPYVRTLYNFRLLNDNAMLRRAGIEDNQIGGVAEVYFGLFTDPKDGCQPRARARVIQEAAGGTGDLSALGAKIAPSPICL